MPTPEQLVRELKTRFRHPITSHRRDELLEEHRTPIGTLCGIMPADCYCVGGAFCIAMGDTESRFPSPPTLGRHLMQQNFELDATKAEEFAIVITDHNDAGNFNKAWELLEEALRYKPTSNS